jgi:selenoprotein W-related protein
VRTADSLLEAFEHDIEGITLIPSGGGVFEVEVDGTLVYKATGRHAEGDEVLERVREIAG